jgi:hypothetical protein
VRSVDNFRYIPSFIVSKLHGSVENNCLEKSRIILPGVEKYHHALNKDSFEILFKMKSELLKSNSVLVIIGYSWNDEHVNQVLSDCLLNGLTIIWMKYDKNDKLHKDFIGKIIKVDVADKPQDTTKSFSEILELVVA